MMTSQKLRRFRQDTKGASMVEFALILPLLITVSIGIYETTRYILLSAKLNEIATGIANWVGAQTSSATITDCFIGANLMGAGYNFSTTGGVVVSGFQLTGSGSTSSLKLVWQKASSGAVSQIITNGSSGAIISSPVSILSGANVIVVEVTYNYQPVFSYFLGVFPAVTLLRVGQSVPTGIGTFNPLPAS